MNDQPKIESPSITKSTKSSKNGKATFAIILAFLALLLAGLSLATQYLIFNMVEKAKAPKMDVRLQKIEPELLQMRTDLNQQREELEKIQSQAQAQPQPETATSNNQTVLSESDYLLTIASYNLMLNQDVDSTIQILQSVGQRLLSLNDPSLLPIRQSLTSDIVALKALPKLDISGIILQLNAISDQIKNLTSLPAKQFSPTKPLIETPPHLSFWEKVKHNLDKLKDVVVIRRTNEPIKPLLLPEQQFYLQQTILMQLNKAQWAVLHKEQNIYQASLQKMIDLLNSHYSQDPKTANLITMLNNLKQINIKPTLPDLTKTLDLVRAASTKASVNTEPVTNASNTQNPPEPQTVASPAKVEKSNSNKQKPAVSSSKATPRTTR